MKWILFLLILGGIAYGVYHFQTEIFDAIENITGKGDDGDGDGDDDGDGGGSGSGGNGGGSDGGNGGTTDGNNGNNNLQFELQYPMPEFKPIEELVGYWQDVPPSAFPRKIILGKDVAFSLQGGVGSTTIKAGKEALALSLLGGQLTVAPRAGSTLRAQVALDDTDFKAVLGAAYDAYKNRKRDEVLQQRERAKLLAATTPARAGTGSQVVDIVPSENLLKEYEAKLGKMPQRAENGTIPVMVASIRNGEVNEIKLDEIDSWGPIRYEVVEREPYWTATVNYKTKSLFGVFPTEAMALMRHSRVEAWVYTGSMEVVP